MRKTNKDILTYGSALLLLFAALFSFSYFRVFDGFELGTYDFRYRIRPSQEVSRDIVIIEIGDDSIEKIGQWPFPRNYHALLINALDYAGVQDIIFDIFFSEKTQEDEGLAAAAADSGKVYLPYVFDIDRSPTDRSSVRALGYAAGMLPELEQAAKATGFANVVPDIDGKVRRMPLFINYGQEVYPLISFKAALDRKKISFDDVRILPGEKVAIPGEKDIPLDEGSYLLVNYAGRWGEGFRHFSYVDILQSYLADVTGQEAVLDLSSLEGAVCFVGVTASASPDAHPSPMENMYPGVGVHAGVYDSVIRGDHIRRLGRVPNMAILALVWFFAVYCTLRLKKRFAGMAFFLIAAGYFCFALILFLAAGVWVDLFYPIISTLAVYFMATLKKYMEETQKREMMEKELNIAKDIQESFLPKALPDLGDMEISVKMITAKQVGGDLYDIFDLGQARVGIMIGDVSGKGFPAALYMAKATSVFKTYVGYGGPGEAVKKTNDRLASESSSGLFVTLSYMVFDTRAGKVEFAMGGHLPSIMIEPDGNVELLDVECGLPLGMMECDFSEGSRGYVPGSIFVFYTDGVTEAMNKKGEMFSLEKLTGLCRDLAGKAPEYVVDAIHREVAVFAGKAEQHDDITVMAVKV
jgi:CHASE2 domain-containing sensor protein